jgi:hypothetical protein
MRRRDGGSAMIAVLLILSILLVLGIGLLSQKSYQYEEMRRANDASQARALAQAGMVDAKLKLLKDQGFPPARPHGETTFSYNEEVTNFDGQVVGAYAVKVFTDASEEPFHVLRVESVGLLGGTSNPRARYQIYGELDIAPVVRNDTLKTVNPNYSRWHYFQEGSRPTNLVVTP